MPVRTKDGWATRGQVQRQHEAWKKAREPMMKKLGDGVDNEAAFEEACERVFKEIDTDKSGLIDHAELAECFKLMDLKLTKVEVDEMIKEADADDNNEIDLEEWKALMKNQVEQFKSRTKSCAVQ
eukprot:TRINITY_DN51391_c0_g1_i1.p2 TRINITY_DN51391_c0_g1~~TRINITY_DN51391_c0_g1_i1.p2  ORF type:complete len:125 (+),score=46.99 TRINITY_DN51391_c0_g1_i1:53-427(+)